MVSIERCKEILNGKGHKYTNEEIKEIRDFLYLLAAIQLEREKQIIN